MSTTNVPLSTLDWSNENKQEAFSEWVDFMTSYFIINNVEERLKHNYILLSTGPKGREIISNALLTAEQKENSEKVFKIFVTHMIKKNKQMGQVSKICVSATEWRWKRQIFSQTTDQSREIRLQCQQKGKDSRANNKRS